MRIVHTEASCGWGGQEIRILNEAEGMIRRGHEVELLCPGEARIFAEAPRHGVQVTALPIGRKNVAGFLAMRRWLSVEQGRRHIDVVNTHSSTDSWLTGLACATLSAAPAMVRTRHISAPVSRNAATRWLYGRASSLVVTTGEILRTSLIDDLGLDAGRVISVPTGIDTVRFHAPTANERAAARRMLGVSGSTLVIGIVATLRSWKGHRYLVDALALWRTHQPALDVRLVIVGDGPQNQVLHSQVDALGVGECVTFAGNQVDVVPWLHAMDIFVLPSYANEGVPQAILQAMSCSLAVITTLAGAIGEVAEDDMTALIVPTQDANAIAQAIQRLAADMDLRAALGARASALVHDRHGIEHMLDAMEQIFFRACTSDKPPA